MEEFKNIVSLEKIIDFMIDDFQLEGYYRGMTKEQILDYYKKRIENYKEF